MLREAEAALYGSAQSILRVILAIPLWLISRLCLYMGTLGTAFPDYFGSLITQTLDHVVSSNIRAILQQSVYVAISLAGLSLLLKPLWPEFRPARLQRIVLWGALIGFFLTQASSCYSTAENTRMTTASNIASIISGGQDSIDIALDMIGATRDEVQTLGFTELPDTVAPLDAPHGSMTIHELFHRCPYDPDDRLDTDADCDLDHASDPFAPSATLNYNLAGLVSLLLGLFPSMLVFAEGLAFLGMGISAGILFVVFPFTALLAFYTPLEGVPAAVIKGYVTILIKTIILSIISAILIDVLQHNFSIGGGPSVVAMAGIGLVEIFIMAMLAKEGLSSIFATFSTITNSVSNVGQNLGVATGGAAQPFSGQPSTEGMAAAAMLGGGNALAMTMMGGANPYMMASMGQKYSPARAVQSAFGASGQVALKTAEPALSLSKGVGKMAMKAGGAALAVATGGASTPVMAVTDVASRAVGVIGQVGNVARQAQALRGGNGMGNRTTLPRPAEAFSSLRPSEPPSPSQALGAEAFSPPHPTEPPSRSQAQNPLMDRYTREGRERMLAARQKLHHIGPDAEEAGLHIITASQMMAADWRRQNRHVQDKDGNLNAQFADGVVRSLDRDQLESFTAAQRDLPPDQRVGLNETIALGAAKPVDVPQQEVRDTFVEAVRSMGKDESLDEAMQRVSNGTLSAGAAFGDQRRAAEQLVQDFRDRGISGDRGAQLIKAVHDDMAKNPDLTVEQFRKNHPVQMEDPVGGWDQMTGGAEHTDKAVAAIINTGKTGDVTVASVPRVRDRGTAGDREAQLIRAVHDDRARTPDQTAEQPRKTGQAKHTDRAAAATVSTAKSGDVAAASAPKAKAREASSPPTPAPSTAEAPGPTPSPSGRPERGSGGKSAKEKTTADAPTPTPPPSGRSGKSKGKPAKVKADATSAMSTGPKESTTGGEK